MKNDKVSWNTIISRPEPSDAPTGMGIRGVETLSAVAQAGASACAFGGASASGGPVETYSRPSSTRRTSWPGVAYLSRPFVGLLVVANRRATACGAMRPASLRGRVRTEMTRCIMVESCTRVAPMTAQMPTPKKVDASTSVGVMDLPSCPR